ncbi:hypothetical protein AAIG11_01835 [Anoxynatronum sibiricum]|uniref:Uncharacterized protein n=2 Tax=Anoxynatronum sibiricum TaxID=210623 RepID=A0ABU9VQC1_9CLOT
MTSERMKTIKMLEELIGYFFRNNINDVQMDLHYGETECKIMLEGTCLSRPADLDQLNELLNTPRQPELEEYYWGLLGGNDTRQELNLLGSLVDCADVSYDLQKLSITVFRKN